MPRNATISIAKGIGIILMVIGHAEAPELLTNIIYTFHMPLFFITAGYFFKRKHSEEPWQFCCSRFRGLYKPFVIWSIVFLLLHNVWHSLGVLNETYGNWTGGVTHPYSLKDFFSRLASIFYSMSGYDEFMAGAFWFFRGLLVASILFMVLFRLVDRRFSGSDMWRGTLVVTVSALAFMALHTFVGFKMSYYPNGFWRETWGIFFFGIGVLYREFEERIPMNIYVAVLCLLIVCVGGMMHFSGMNNSCKPIDLITLPITGCAGFIMLKYVSELIDKNTAKLRRALVYVGDNTLYIFIFHIISFKVVSLLKIWWYGLDFGQIGCHMVIHYRNHEDIFWILYSIAGVVIPLAVLAMVRKSREKLKGNLTPSVS